MFYFGRLMIIGLFGLIHSVRSIPTDIPNGDVNMKSGDTDRGTVAMNHIELESSDEIKELYAKAQKLYVEATWVVIHSMAIKSPDKIETESEKNNIYIFLERLVKLCPGQNSEFDFLQMFHDNKPKLGGKEDFGQWACEIHNQVSEIFKAKKVDCAEWESSWIKYKDRKNDEESNELASMQYGEFKSVLGNATWTIIHIMALYGPVKFNDQHKKDILEFFEYLQKIYPCEECQQGMGGILKKSPPEVEDGENFADWTYKFHNFVNNRLKKPQADDKWRDHWLHIGVIHKKILSTKPQTNATGCQSCMLKE